MAKQPNFDDARRQLDAALGRLAAESADDHAAEPPAAAPPEPPPAVEAPLPVQTTEALTRLAVGAAVLLLDELATRAGAWERAAGITRGVPGDDGSVAIPVRAPAGERFRHGLIGWIFATEEELRPQGNPLQWLRGVAGHLSGSLFAVVLDNLPRLGPLAPPTRPEPSEQEIARWAARGQLEEERSRAFARAALDDTLAAAIPALARQPGVQRAVAELLRAPAVDEAIVTLARRPGMQQALAELARSPAMGEAVRAIVRSPAMEEAVTYLVGTRAMGDAIETLAQSTALEELVQKQSSSIAGAIVEEVRERAVSADTVVEGLARRLLRRPSRSQLPNEARGLMVRETRRP